MLLGNNSALTLGAGKQTLWYPIVLARGSKGNFKEEEYNKMKFGQDTRLMSPHLPKSMEGLFIITAVGV